MDLANEFNHLKNLHGPEYERHMFKLKVLK